MMVTQMGSLNALEQEKGNRFWHRWLKADLSSADNMGDVYVEIDIDSIRSVIHHVYNRLKRNKVFHTEYGLNVLILDGHEHTCSYLRCCKDCLTRKIETKKGERIQYYHRNVIAMLSGGKFSFLIDVEEQMPGEDEVAAATRLIKRMLRDYPRAFDIVSADGLYLRANFFNLLLDHGKDIIAVLKDDRRDLLKDAKGLFSDEKALITTKGRTKRTMYDIEGFTSWDALNREIRVVRSEEIKTICRQLTGKKEKETADWIWATTLSKEQVPTELVVDLGHDRWLIENKAINEMVTYWHADHVYKHHSNAITAFWLTLIFVLNLFRAFVNLNIKLEYRVKHTGLYFARRLFAGLYSDVSQIIPP